MAASQSQTFLPTTPGEAETETLFGPLASQSPEQADGQPMETNEYAMFWRNLMYCAQAEVQHCGTEICELTREPVASGAQDMR